LLKAIAGAMQAQRDALLELSIANGGNTRSDAKFDIDGAIGTLLAYAEIGTSLGSQKFLLDGEGMQRAAPARFHGQHVLCAPRGGGARQRVQFPGLGLAEKAATALLGRDAGA